MSLSFVTVLTSEDSFIERTCLKYLAQSLAHHKCLTTWRDESSGNCDVPISNSFAKPHFPAHKSSSLVSTSEMKKGLQEGLAGM